MTQVEDNASQDPSTPADASTIADASTTADASTHTDASTSGTSSADASPPSSARGYYGAIPEPLPPTPKLVLHDSLLGCVGRQPIPFPPVSENARTALATEPATKKPLHIRVDISEVITVHPAAPEMGITVADVLEAILRHPQGILQPGPSEGNSSDLVDEEGESVSSSWLWKGLFPSGEGNDIWMLNVEETIA